MRLLAIDTALEACSVGVDAGGVAAPVRRSETLGRGHAERLMGMIGEAMDEAGLAMADLDRIAVTVGPGSFTGLRIGIAAARGLALVTRCELVGIGTLDVHAAHARAMISGCAVLAVLDARRGEVYGQFFAADGTPVGAPEAASPQDFVERFRDDTLLAGSGAGIVAEAIGGGAARRIVHRRSAPDIGALLRLAAEAPVAAEPPKPLYLRPPDAKPQSGAAIRMATQ